MALTDTIYEKVRSSFFPAAIRFALKTEKVRSSYLCNYGLCWPLFRSSTLFSLPNSVLPNKTDFLPTREGLWGWTRYEEWIYICARKLLAGGRSTVRARWYWFRFDKGIMPGRGSSTVGSRRVRFVLASEREIGNAPCLLLRTLTFTWQIHPISLTLKGGQSNFHWSSFPGTSCHWIGWCHWFSWRQGNRLRFGGKRRNFRA